MKDVLDRLDEIHQKVDKLSETVRRLTEENQRLQSLVEQKSGERAHYERSYHELTEKYQTLKLTKGVANGNGSQQALKEKIDAYIQEIDQCLKILGSH
ncbi:MAG: hypothetical protein AAGI38_07735 [Bacteroidota bacterium]